MSWGISNMIFFLDGIIIDESCMAKIVYKGEIPVL
jgi:hypothetical protein